MFRPLFLVTAATVALSLCGCDLAPKPTAPAGASSHGSPPSKGSRGVASSMACAFEPRTINIHPMTRIVIPRTEPRDKASGDRTIDAYLELFDEAGDGVKGMGAVLFELYRGESAAAEQLARWNESINDPRSNAARYDRVSRCYRFELGLEGVNLPSPARPDRARLELRARFTTTDGRSMSAARVIAE